MKKFLLPVLLSGASLFAAPLNTQYVSGDAKWVAHVDMEKLLQSQSRQVIKDFMGSETFKNAVDSDKFDMTKLEEGRDRIEKIRSITFYGSVMGEGEGVAIVEGDLDLEDLSKNVFKRMSDYTTQAHNGMTVYSWKGKRRNKTVLMTQYNSDTYIFAGKMDQIDLGSKVLSGNETNLSQSKNGLKEKMTNLNAPLMMAVLGEMPKMKRSMVMQKSKSMVYTFSEKGGEAKSLLTIEFDNDNDAAQVQGIMNGFKAFASLSGDKFEGLAELAAKHLITQKGNKVEVDLSFTPAEMKDWLTLVAQNIPKWKKNKHCPK